MSAVILKGAPVSEALDKNTAQRVLALKVRGVTPTLAVLRVGQVPDDLSYERGAKKRCDKVGIALRSVALPADVTAGDYFAALEALNRDVEVHGILLLRPLPPQLDAEAARRALDPAKDVDGCTDGSLAAVFSGLETGFAPCTAQACMEILDFYGVECAGRRAAVLGRSLVVGRPVSMLLLGRNATVTMCHSRTKDAPALTGQADIVIAAVGRSESLGAAYFREGQTVLDVGIGWSEAKQKLCGDVDFAAVEPLVHALTPVPGGVGAVTTAVLAAHVATAAERKEKA